MSNMPPRASMETGTPVLPNGRVGTFAGVAGLAGCGGGSIGLRERLAGADDGADAHDAEGFDEVPAGNIIFFHRIICIRFKSSP